jgi:hypothetical protein
MTSNGLRSTGNSEAGRGAATQKRSRTFFMKDVTSDDESDSCVFDKEINRKVFSAVSIHPLDLSDIP